MSLLPYDDTSGEEQYDTSIDSYCAFYYVLAHASKTCIFMHAKTLGFLNFPLTPKQSLEEFYD